MEVRCGKCSKLFHVSNDRITGKGIKFACTRCGEYVRITKEDLESFTLSQSAVPALGESAQMPASVAPPIETEAPRAESAASETVFAEPSFAHEPAPEAAPEIFTTPSVPDFLKETAKLEPPAEPLSEAESELERAAFAPENRRPEHRDVTPAAQAKVAPKEPVAAAAKVVPEAVRGPASTPSALPISPEPAVATKPAPATVPKPSAQPKPVVASPVSAPRPAPPKPEPVRPSMAAAPTSVTPKKEAAPVKAEAPSFPGAAPSAPEESNKAVLAVVLLILALLGSGIYWYLQKPSPTTTAPDVNLISTEGLVINNASATPDANGDLLISGEIENTTDRERKDWYIVVDVLDATGTVVGKIRSLNGRQIFTHDDYEIMAKRGSNLQEMKEAAVKAYTAVLPPKGRVAFEMRYLQPPVGVATFNAAVQSADRERLIKEIAREAR